MGVLAFLAALSYKFFAHKLQISKTNRVQATNSQNALSPFAWSFLESVSTSIHSAASETLALVQWATAVQALPMLPQ
ncbi:MAG: hypothetical protein RBJ76_03020 [Stenomitos frigidus ULC029]